MRVFILDNRMGAWASLSSKNPSFALKSHLIARPLESSGSLAIAWFRSAWDIRFSTIYLPVNGAGAEGRLSSTFFFLPPPAAPPLLISKTPGSWSLKENPFPAGRARSPPMAR